MNNIKRPATFSFNKIIRTLKIIRFGVPQENSFYWMESKALGPCGVYIYTMLPTHQRNPFLYRKMAAQCLKWLPHDV